MKKEDWLAEVTKHKDRLTSIISGYHPVARQQARVVETEKGLHLDGINTMPITAPNAEMACENIRQHIVNTHVGNPITQFLEALSKEDDKTIYKLLSDTWFGIPESTSCWNIPGFTELVNLMDDPVDVNELDVERTESYDKDDIA